jgi:hypothetical protein
MVRWSYIPLVLFGSVTYDIRIWIRIPRSKVLHSCLTAALICGQKQSACQIIAGKGAGQKKEEKGRYFFYAVCAYVCGN